MLQKTANSPCDFLHSCLRGIKRENPRLSTSQIAKKLNVSQSSLCRIENRDVETPKFDTALSIVRMAYPNEEDYGKLLAKYYPEFGEVYDRVYSANHQDAVFAKKEAEPFFEDPNTYQYSSLPLLIME